MIKSLAKRLPFMMRLIRLKRDFSAFRHPLQNTGTLPGYELIQLGTEYGGWTLAKHPALHGSTIISAGVGEDISFDVAFANKFNARVVLVDPTPKAVNHYTTLAARFGCESSAPFEKGTGSQPAEAYDLKELEAQRLTLVPKALWNEKTVLKFFMPPNPDHVSCSIGNYQNNYRDDTKHIEVESTTVHELVENIGLDVNGLALIKLDIEGAEIEVIQDMLDKDIKPAQILVEFDELNAPSKEGHGRIDSAHASLTQHGYKCIHTDGQTDFLYVREDAFQDATPSNPA
ncbi:MAG: hypothetical protein CMJ53_03440 [Planctomycetaceae bacterium]|nr:hypothetical protein [Planctomycetaceae bacterium]